MRRILAALWWQATRRGLWRVIPRLGPPPALPEDHPDGHLRHVRLAAAITGEFSGGSVLAAGDRNLQLRRHLPGFSVDSTDLAPAAVPVPDGVRYVEVDFTRCESEFADASYDLVASTDVLEHIPRPMRREFLRQAHRIARRAAFIALPAGEDARLIESLILRSRTRRNFREALSEHAREGHPLIPELEADLQELGIEYELRPVTSVSEWLTSFVFDAGDREDQRLLRDYHEFLNQRVGPAGAGGPVYRYLLVMRKAVS